jgi:hypothetical protein
VFYLGEELCRGWRVKVRDYWGRREQLPGGRDSSHI